MGEQYHSDVTIFFDEFKKRTSVCNLVCHYCLEMGHIRRYLLLQFFVMFFL